MEYSDGFGRLLQTRAQAEDVIFGNQTFGSSGLSSNQSDQNTPAIGVEREENDPLNVVVSGWQIYNNKGAVVEQYEPFFDQGFEYTLPHLSSTVGNIAPQLGVKMKMYYDPVGRVVRTVNPDSSEQRMIYGIPSALNTPDSFAPSPWENYAYDANDLAPLTNPGSNVPQSNWYTPKSALTDALGRTIKTTEHQAHYNADTDEYENVVMRYLYDIRGNLLEVLDPYNRKVFEHVYDLRPPQEDENGESQPLPPLWTKHIDQGAGNILFDAIGKSIEFEDAKGAKTLSTYDALTRQDHLWAKDKIGMDFTLRQIMEYGDSAGLIDPENENLKGQIYKHYDEAGLVTVDGYDFKGNLLEKNREVISDVDLLAVFNGPPTNWEVEYYHVDWDNPPTLEGNYLTSMEYDAMNRITKMIYPEDVESARKELIPNYNRAGALESVKMDGNDYVNHIAYNAKGQRILIAHGNNVMTRYAYDNHTFRLLRQRSEKYIQNNWIFTPDGSVRQDSKYTYYLMGNIVNSNEANVSTCGIGGSNSLTREFNYDPLYRLLNANGRENSPTITPIWDDRYRSTDNTTTTAYTQHYSYDRLGNIQKLQHIGNNNFTRNFNYTNINNQLQSIEIGMTNYAFTYDNCGNQLTETTSRHFEWDFGNRLRSFYVQAGISEPTQYAQYLYDAGGTRVKKLVRTQGGSYTSTVYIDDVFEYKTDGTDEQNLLHIMDDQSRVALLRLGNDFGDTTPAIKYNLEDYLGNSCILLETNGALINKEEYYPFGETSFGSYGKKRYKFSGKERDEESGLYYCRYRYHSAWTCRFISVDPLSSKYPNFCSYSYCGNMVITYRELEGLEPNVDLNTADPGKVYQGSNKGDKSSVKNRIIYNWKINVSANGSRSWVQDGTIYEGPTKVENANMAEHVYSTDDNNVKIGSFASETKYELVEKFNGGGGLLAGFKAGLYVREIDGVNFYTLAFAGTDDIMDAIDDISAGLGIANLQIILAKYLSVKVNNLVNNAGDGNHLSFTGHSLGGGLAAIASFATGRKATTFNAMGISSSTALSAGLSTANSSSLIKAYIIRNEILNETQPTKANGFKFMINAPTDRRYTRLDLHSIEIFTKLWNK